MSDFVQSTQQGKKTVPPSAVTVLRASLWFELCRPHWSTADTIAPFLLNEEVWQKQGPRCLRRPPEAPCHLPRLLVWSMKARLAAGTQDQLERRSGEAEGGVRV